jgi:hypothetical protein
MLTDAVMLPSAEAGADGTVDAGLSLLLDVTKGGQILLDAGGIGTTGIVAAIDEWPDLEKRARARRTLMSLNGLGRLVRVPAGSRQTGCTDACNALRSVASDWTPSLVVVGESCRAEVSGSFVAIGDYIGSLAQERLQRQGLTFSRTRSTEDDLERDALAPFLRFAESVVVFDRYIGRSIQEGLPQGHPARVKEGFDRTVRLLLDCYMTSSRVKGRFVRLVTGVWTDRPGADVAFAALQAWARDLAAAYPAVPVKLDTRGETRYAQLEHDRYLISNQASMLVSTGLELLFTNSMMRDAGLDPTRDARRVRTSTLTLMPPAGWVILDADTLPPFAP